MRQKLQQQLSIPPDQSPSDEHHHVRELAGISDILDAHPQVLALVFADLCLSS